MKNMSDLKCIDEPLLMALKKLGPDVMRRWVQQEIPTAGLSNEPFLTQLDFSDAMLGDEGIALLAESLKTNLHIRILNMRGNNIRSDGALALGSMLKVNRSITCLNLEWNAVGVWEAGVGCLADALAVNVALTTLDLRNNRIDQRGAARLAAGINHNNTLCNLDLRWNNAGMLGGRALADMLQMNSSLVSLLTAGNCIPPELDRVITMATTRNSESKELRDNGQAKAVFAEREICSIRDEHQLQLSNLRRTIEEGELHRQVTLEKIEKLQDLLNDHRNTLERTEKKLVLSETNRESAEGRIRELSEEVIRQRESALNNEAVLQRNINDLQTANVKLKEELRTEMEQHILLQTRAQDAELRRSITETELESIKAEVALLDERHRSRLEDFDECLRRDRSSNATAVEQLIKEKESAIEAVRIDANGRVRATEERLRVAMSAQTTAEEEAKHLLFEMQSLKSRSDERVRVAEGRVNEEEAVRIQRLEERLGMMQTARDDDSVRSEKQLQQIHSLEMRNSELLQSNTSSAKKHAAETEHRIAELSDIQTELGRAKVEIMHLKKEADDMEVARRRDERKHEEEEENTAHKIKRLNADLMLREAENAALCEEVRRKGAEVDALRDDELKRVSVLEGALSSYISGTKSRHNNVSPSTNVSISNTSHPIK